MSKIARIEAQKAQAMQSQAEQMAEILARLGRIEVALKKLAPEKDKKNEKPDETPKA